MNGDITTDLFCSCGKWLAEVFVDSSGRAGWVDHPSPLLNEYDDVRELRADVLEAEVEGVSGFAAICRACAQPRWISVDAIIGQAEITRRKGLSNTSVSL